MFQNLGFQLFTIRNHVNNADEIRASLAKVRELGYNEIQTTVSAVNGVTYAEFSELAKEAGITVIGTHYKLKDMLENFEQTVADHQALGTTNCGIGGFHSTGLEEVKRFIETANDLADRLYRHGIKFTYHNHSHEFIKVTEDQTIMDMLVEGLDPEKTSFVLDTAWVQLGGGDPAYWIEKLGGAGRLDILHLKDYSRSTDKEKPVILQEVGYGNLNFDSIMKAAEKVGVKYYCVEQDGYWKDDDPFISLKMSADYLAKYRA